MQKRRISFITAMLIASLSFSAFSSVQAKESTSSSLNVTINVLSAKASVAGLNPVAISETYVNEALADPSFGRYNIAYAEIMKVTDPVQREMLMVKLGSIADKIYTPDVLYFLNLIVQLSETGSGRIYDQLEAELRASKLSVMDREYLLGELTSWGKKMVYTKEYVAGIDSIVTGWNTLVEFGLAAKYTKVNPKIAEAEVTIGKIPHKINREYLMEQLQGLKDRVKLDAVYDEEATNRLFELAGDDYFKLAKSNPSLYNYKPDLVWQSIINITQGKDVEEELKTPWVALEYNSKKYSTKYSGFTHKVHNTNRIGYKLSDNLADTIDKVTYARIRIFIGYWDPNIEKWEVHNVVIGL